MTWRVFPGRLMLAVLAVVPAWVRAANGEASPSGSTAFCLFEIPAPAERRTWLNLGIVQYVELRATEVVIDYGGGNFGSGHDARIPVRDAEQAQAVIESMKTTAARCAGK